MSFLTIPGRPHPLRSLRQRLSAAPVRAGFLELAHRALAHQSGQARRAAGLARSRRRAVGPFPGDRIRRAQRRRVARDTHCRPTTGRATPAITSRCSTISASSAVTSWARASACRSRSRSRKNRRSACPPWSCRTRSACRAPIAPRLTASSRNGPTRCVIGRSIDPPLLSGFHQRMFGGEFIFSVTREFVRGCAIPMLLMPGDDVVHPAEVSADLAARPESRDARAVERARATRVRDAPRPRIPDRERAGSRRRPAMTRIAVLDDWQNAARSSADWSPLIARADVQFFAGAIRRRRRCGEGAGRLRYRARHARAHAFPALARDAPAAAEDVRPHGRARRAGRYRGHDRARHRRLLHRRRPFGEQHRGARAGADARRGAPHPAGRRLGARGHVPAWHACRLHALRQDHRPARPRPHRRADGALLQRARACVSSPGART